MISSGSQATSRDWRDDGDHRKNRIGNWRKYRYIKHLSALAPRGAPGSAENTRHGDLSRQCSRRDSASVNTADRAPPSGSYIR